MFLRSLCLKRRPHRLSVTPHFYTGDANLLSEQEAVNSYVEQNHKAWLREPRSVHTSWAEFFESVPAEKGSSFQPGEISQELDEYRLAVRTQQLVQAYRVFGHYRATLDPLGLEKRKAKGTELHLSTYGLTDEDKDKIVPPLDPKTLAILGHGSEESLVLGDLVKKLEASYCGRKSPSHLLRSDP